MEIPHENEIKALVKRHTGQDVRCLLQSNSINYEGTYKLKIRFSDMHGVLPFIPVFAQSYDAVYAPSPDDIYEVVHIIENPSDWQSIAHGIVTAFWRVMPPGEDMISFPRRVNYEFGRVLYGYADDLDDNYLRVISHRAWLDLSSAEFGSALKWQPLKHWAVNVTSKYAVTVEDFSPFEIEATE